jgi:hypothetical protein
MLDLLERPDVGVPSGSERVEGVGLIAAESDHRPSDDISQISG